MLDNSLAHIPLPKIQNSVENPKEFWQEYWGGRNICARDFPYSCPVMFLPTLQGSKPTSRRGRRNEMLDNSLAHISLPKIQNSMLVENPKEFWQEYWGGRNICARDFPYSCPVMFLPTLQGSKPTSRRGRRNEMLDNSLAHISLPKIQNSMLVANPKEFWQEYWGGRNICARDFPYSCPVMFLPTLQGSKPTLRRGRRNEMLDNSLAHIPLPKIQNSMLVANPKEFWQEYWGGRNICARDFPYSCPVMFLPTLQGSKPTSRRGRRNEMLDNSLAHIPLPKIQNSMLVENPKEFWQEYWGGRNICARDFPYSCPVMFLPTLQGSKPTLRRGRRNEMLDNSLAHIPLPKIQNSMLVANPKEFWQEYWGGRNICARDFPYSCPVMFLPTLQGSKPTLRRGRRNEMLDNSRAHIPLPIENDCRVCSP